MKEILVVPEENLKDVIRVIRAGLKSAKKVPSEVRDALLLWCGEEEEYLKNLSGE